MSKTYAYLRVSKIDQEIEENKANILKLDHQCELGHVNFVEGKVSRYKVSWKKRQIADIIINDVQPSDIIIVSELSRLGRSMLEIIEILSIAIQREINICAVKGDWKLSKDSIQSKIMAIVYTMPAEIERDLISPQIKEALQARKQQGVISWWSQNSGSPSSPVQDELIRILLFFAACFRGGYRFSRYCVDELFAREMRENLSIIGFHDISFVTSFCPLEY